MTITPLGAGQEVGRSCHLLQFRDMTIMLDCGIHPGYKGTEGLPLFENIDPASVDLLLITHFHLDHIASLPYFTERTEFRGRIFMTHATRACARLLLGDYIRLMDIKGGPSANAASNPAPSSSSSSSAAAAAAAAPDGVLYTEDDLKSCLSKIELLDYHSVQTVGSCTFWAYNAGHVLGAAMFLLSLGGRTVLYTGDYSMEEDRHLMAAEYPDVKVDVLIVEATYGTKSHPTREEREAIFTGTVERVVTRGGRCLIPVFSLGRAQELLLILDEFWEANAKLQHVPIYYASKLASKALRVYQTYVNMMNARIRRQMDLGNPFQFRHIQNLKGIDVDDFDDRGPAVVFASPGMLQNGVSRQLFERWCPDEKNGVIIAGYAVEHTLAKELMDGDPRDIPSMDGVRRLARNCTVQSVSFSAHVDFIQNRDFICRVEARHVILVHGQKNEMGKLRNALVNSVFAKMADDKRPTVDMPANGQTVSLPFARRRQAKVMGALARAGGGGVGVGGGGVGPVVGPVVGHVKEGHALTGVLYTQNFVSRVVAPEDLATYTQLRVGAVSSRVHVPFVGSRETLRLFLNEMFADVVETETTTTEEEESPSDAGAGAAAEAEAGGTAAALPPPPPPPPPQTRTTTSFSLSRSSGNVVLTVGSNTGVATLDWDAGPVGDLLADSAIALIMHAQSSAAGVRLASRPCGGGGGGGGRPHDSDTGTDADADTGTDKKKRKKRENTPFLEGEDLTGLTSNEIRLRVARKLLLDLYADVTADLSTGSFVINCEKVDGKDVVCEVNITFDEDGQGCKIRVQCEDETQGMGIRNCLRQMADATAPINI